ncbi:MAG: hypothetical protein UR96_C0010G0011 [candidate division WS6 bacterium GW2011_GWC1_36_11]|uniref:Uncharacterized protein n=2 Tax=Candidatus Dojkabacteria TaxID=74243 RepID=A0A0G0DGK4_9BACT|nr:MAG: hypothetical protein UR96_C0010G0011 [candidate division WS6 bacterium GW2011_GWC1_36_11]KKQ04666.1 MAG: hypothetical protein US14_C0003G0029 [candidate division WS6 bacterium GW2011_WS6_36_26]KKQ16967.1 MAG: hypothetical protein US29_C0015G0011 [candidate division WS6 bacterium GW2011_GWF1_36_8]
MQTTTKILNKKTNTTQNKQVRIYNPVTNSYYQIRQKTASSRRRGSIIEKWASKNLSI